MKFMVLWEVQEDKRLDTLKAFSEMTAADDAAELGENLKLVGRWHDLVGFTGVAICETDDPGAVHNWLLNWNGVINVEVRPVLDDAETREIGRARFAED